MALYEAEILPLRDLDLGDGDVFRLSDRKFAAEIAESMDAFVRSFDQPIQVAHEDTGCFYGNLVSVYLDETAERIKVRFRTEQQEVINNIDSEKTKYVSAGFAAPYTTLDGQHFSAALLEVSLTSTPRFLAGDNGQAPIRKLEQEGTVLSLQRRNNTTERFHCLSESKLTIGDEPMNEELVEKILAELAGIKEMLAAAAPEPTEDPKPEEDPAPVGEEPKDEELAYEEPKEEDLSARVAELEAKLKEKEDGEKLTAMLSEALEGKEAPTEAKLAVLKKLALSDEASFKVLASELPELAHAGLPVKPVKKEKQDLSHKSVPNKPNRVSGDKKERVNAYQKEHNCTFAEAFKAVGI